MNKGITSCVLCALCIMQDASASSLDSETEIRHVIEQFRVSIINKDKAVFSSLFFNENIPFIAVFSEEMLARKRIENPKYPAAVDFSQFGPPVKMLSGDKAEEEKIWNIKVQTDGHLASVHFNYSDHVSARKRAWGTESWSLVKVDSDWKITSVSFTVTEVEGEK
ncbi:hypothetical protein [Thalassotalea sp. PP2-459]|uniref:hypothetical protein n=1 Tax=Thalassotalea sp. PP2-459 TaxID=1742724 RepID=UPI001115095B|nr:hypothetical protein [Thalassotalea sp. PP2-459]